MKKVIIIITTVIVFLTFLLFAENKSIKKSYVGDLVNSNAINAKIIGLGSYMGNCISIEFQNNLTVDTSFIIEAGRRLQSEDTTKQDILIVKEQELFVKAKSKIKTDIYGFCCEASNGAPPQKQVFKIGKMADSSLAMIARFINREKFTLSQTALQHAIWCISDNHQIESIHEDDENLKEEVKKLRNQVAKIKGLSFDNLWYSLTYTKDSLRLFSNNPETLHGEFEYYISENAVVSLIIYNIKGQAVHRLFVNVAHDHKDYKFKFKLDVSQYEKGVYYVRLLSNNQLKKERTFKL